MKMKIIFIKPRLGYTYGMKHLKPTPQVPLARCHHTRLAVGDLAAIDACECGTLHLHLGALTLRLSEDALSELVGTLGYALAQLRVREGQLSRAEALAHSSGVPHTTPA